MSLAPTYERPAAPVPAAYAPELAPAGAAGAAAAADIEWQRFFGDARLRAPDRASRCRTTATCASRSSTSSRRARPTRSGAPTSCRRWARAPPRSASPVPAAGSSTPTPSACRSPATSSTSSAACEPEPGRAGAIPRHRGGAQDGADHAGRVGRQRLPQPAGRRRAAARDAQTLATREESFKLTKLKFDNGAASELDFRQAESLLEGRASRSRRPQRQRALDENALVLLLGQALPADLPPPLALGSQQVSTDLPAGLPSELLVRRPDVRAAEQQLLAANANIGAARAAFFPRISLTGERRHREHRAVGPVQERLLRLHRHRAAAAADLRRRPQPGQPRRREGQPRHRGRAVREGDPDRVPRGLGCARRPRHAGRAAARAGGAGERRAGLVQAGRPALPQRRGQLPRRARRAARLFTAQQAVVQVQALQAQNLVTLYKVLGGGWTDAPVKAN